MTLTLVFVTTWWLIFLALLTSYFIYPLFIHLLPAMGKKTPSEINEQTTIYLIIPCYNEEAVIEEKIHNSFSIHSNLSLHVYVVIDKSDDNTFEKASALRPLYSNLHIINKDYRKGKNDSINLVVDHIKPNPNDLLFFTDSNTFFREDVIDNFIKEFYDGSVLVGGSMVYVDQSTKSAKAEGLYWKYEEWIRRNESKHGRLIAMNGGIIVMVAKYFEPIPTFIPNDFEAPLRLASRHRVTFSESAVGIESAIAESAEEFKRKRRMANRQMNAVIYHWSRMSFSTKLQAMFHKVIRWFGLQLFIIQILITVDLAAESRFFYLVAMFNATAITMVLLSIALKRVKYFSTIYHALAVHHFGFLGAFSSLFGNKVSTWSKATSNR